MKIFQQITQQFNYLLCLLEQLSPEQYTFKSTYLADASIAGHTRHIIEIFQCMLYGYQSGQIDYFNRNRNFLIESNKQLAIDIISDVVKSCHLVDKSLILMGDDESQINTTYYRELNYNLEHMIHHLALIKVSLTEMNLNITDKKFGFAYSTLQYMKETEKS
jgi:hypothetical protein